MSAHLTHPSSENTGKAILRGAPVFVALIFGVALALEILILVAGAFGLDAVIVQWGQALTIAGAGLGLAALAIITWHDYRYVLVETIASSNYASDTAAHAVQVKAEAEANALTIKAQADKELAHAEAELKLANADAIDRASMGQVAQLNLNSGSGTQKVNNKPITYSVNGQVVGNQLNQLTINQAEPRRIEISAADVRWFAEQLANGYGHSKSKWVGVVKLEFSQLPVTYDIYKMLVDPLVESEPPAIVGRGPRASGSLVETNPAQLVKLIEQKHPSAGSKGIVLELPAIAEAGKAA